MKRVRMRMLLGMLMIWMSSGAFCGGIPIAPKQDYWMGMYYNQQKIGSLHVVVKEDEVDGKDRLCRNETLRIRYRIPNKNFLYNIERHLLTDTTFAPISDSHTIDYTDSSRSGYYPTTSEITYGLSSAKWKTTANGVVDVKTMPITEHDRAVVVAGNQYDMGRRKLSPGDRFDINHFRYMMKVFLDTGNSLNLGEASVYVMRAETVTVNGIAYNTIVTSEKYADAYTIVWHLDNGEIVKWEMPEDHIVWLRESKENATEIDEGEGPLLDPNAKSAVANNVSAELLERSLSNFDYWMGVYSGTTKLGYVHITTKQDKLDGKDVFRREEIFHSHMNSSGKSFNVDINHVQYVDSTFFPILETMSITGGDPDKPGPKSSTAEYRYGKDMASCKYSLGDDLQTTMVPLTEEDRAKIVAGRAYVFGMLRLPVGKSIDVNHSYYTIERDKNCKWKFSDAMISVLRRETLNLNGVTYDTLVISDRAKNGRETTRWQLDTGEILKEDIPQEDLIWVREGKEKATEIDRMEPPKMTK
ncbi:hypothetical protein LLG39_18110 [bacterium]|nr:hypothetical protein [bacterium]